MKIFVGNQHHPMQEQNIWFSVIEKCDMNHLIALNLVI